MRRLDLNSLQMGIPSAKDLQKMLQQVGRKLQPAFIGVAISAASYLFILLLVQEDKLGNRTLSILSWLVMILRGLGHMIDERSQGSLIPALGSMLSTFSVFFVAVLIVAARYFFLHFRQIYIHIRLKDVAIVEILVLWAAAMIFILYGNLELAALTALLSGITLLVISPHESVQKENENRLLFLIPLGLGLVLRCYALAQVPNGYAQHAAILHAELSLPLFEALSASLAGHHLQPFLGMVWDQLLHEQSGALPLVEALGFKLFGVSLTVTRLVSAVLGMLTIYVAYRLGQALGGIRLGLAFSFLLAVSPWHVTISRYATAEHVLSPLQFLLSLLFIIRAVNGSRVIDILLAAFFTSLGLFIYSTSLAVPVIVAVFLLCRGVAEPRLALRNWGPILLGLGFFAVLSFMPVSQDFPLGILAPNIRTGHLDAGPLLTNWPERFKMAGLEADQLFLKTDDPWFATPGAGLGTFQIALLLPGILLAAKALRYKRDRDFGLLALIGLPIAALPAIFASDASFRRLMLVTTLAALVAAFTLVKFIETAEFASVSRKIIIMFVCAGALALSASGAFGYFDRVFTGEEIGNAWFRSLGTIVTNRVGKEPLVVVVPNQDDTFNMNRYIKLMAYDVLSDAKKRGIPLASLYTVTFCRDNVNASMNQAAEPQAGLLILPDSLLDLPQPCGPEYLARLVAQHPGNDVMIVTPPLLPADLVPAQP